MRHESLFAQRGALVHRRLGPGAPSAGTLWARLRVVRRRARGREEIASRARSLLLADGPLVGGRDDAGAALVVTLVGHDLLRRLASASLSAVVIASTLCSS